MESGRQDQDVNLLVLNCGFGNNARFGDLGDWIVDEGRVVRLESFEIGISER